MESAREFADNLRESSYSIDELERILTKRDAAIRAKCADRALEAIGNIPPSKRAIWDVVETTLRAAIMGEEER